MLISSSRNPVPAPWWIAAGVAATLVACGGFPVFGQGVEGFLQNLPARLKPGAEIYAHQCAACHGSMGGGGDAYARPLAGPLDLPALVTVIQETMPEESPGSLTDAEARQVGEFVFEAFYSSRARERARPPQIALARLTVEEYRATVMDLLTPDRQPVPPDAPQGLAAVYVSSGNPHDRKSSREERTDSTIDFDFGVEPPIESFEDPRNFSIRWHGSLYAPESGKYEISIFSRHAVKLYLNGAEPLIDAWVKSEENDEFAASIELIGGRYYPIVLEYSKSQQGVQDKIDKDAPVQPSAITLRWQRPNGSADVISGRYLVPVQTGGRFICRTPFPPDDRSYGWIRGTEISPEWDRATTQAAIEAARFVGDRLDRLVGIRPDATDRAERVRDWCFEFAQRAFRERLAEGDPIREFIQQELEAAEDLSAAVRRIVLLTLKSPRFLYRELVDPESEFATAARISYGLWGTLPDTQLWEAAVRGELTTSEQVRAQADRLLADPRADYRLLQFLRSWLQMDAEHIPRKNAARFPEFPPDVLAALRESLELSLIELIQSDAADYRELIRGNRFYVDDRLAELFGAESVAAEDFRPVRLDPEHRAGVLTHPYLLAQFAYAEESSPIHRGVFIARNLLGKTLQPPPEAFAPLPPELHADLTTRERVALQTEPQACMSCHQIINPLGFTLEQFDAVGRLREKDNHKPVDTRVELEWEQAGTVTVGNARELAELILSSEEAQTAFCERMFQFLVGQPIGAYGEDVPRRLRETFAEREFNLKHLAREIIAVSALQGRTSVASLEDNDSDSMGERP